MLSSLRAEGCTPENVSFNTEGKDRFMKFLDIFKNSRPIFNMAERQMRMAATQPFHKIGPFLKGKVKALRGYAYEGIKEVFKGRTFMRMNDRVYQVAPNGQWLRCVIMKGRNGKTEIRPRF